jgi:hypothetical protein
LRTVVCRDPTVDAVMPRAIGLQEVVNAFAAAPTRNQDRIRAAPASSTSERLVYDDLISDPTGTLSTVDVRPSVGPMTGTPMDDVRFGTTARELCGGWLGSDADRRKTDCVARRFATLATCRYALFANRNSDSNASGTARQGGDVLAVTLGIFNKAKRSWVAAGPWGPA